MKMREFYSLFDIAAYKDRLKCEISGIGRPEYVAGKKVPETINHLSMGVLLRLVSVKNDLELMGIIATDILGVGERELLDADAVSVLGCMNWIVRESGRVVRLFNGTTLPSTPEEKQAGVESLNFGLFGMVDYYALRMGITDHEAVERVPWMRVYKCLDMDSKRARYERRLRKVYERKGGRKK